MTELKSLMRGALVILGIMLFIAGIIVFFIMQGEEVGNERMILFEIMELMR